MNQSLRFVVISVSQTHAKQWSVVYETAFNCARSAIEIQPPLSFNPFLQDITSSAFVFGGMDSYTFALTQTDGKSEGERDMPSFGCQYHCAHSFCSVLYVTVCLSLTHTHKCHRKLAHTATKSRMPICLPYVCVRDWNWTAKIMCQSSYSIVTGGILSQEIN